MNREPPATVRPPVAFGCFVLAAVVVFIVAIGAFAVIFLESGADTGKVRLDVPEAYARGSVEYVGAENLFVVRLPDGSFLALSDLDAANRANPAHRCRGAVMSIDDPMLGDLPSLRSRVTAAAAGSKLVIREACNGVSYDITGARLAGDGRNLDRYAVTVSSDGHVTVDTAARQCSERTGATVAAATACD